jgi:hypothetical protein
MACDYLERQGETKWEHAADSRFILAPQTRHRCEYNPYSGLSLGLGSRRTSIMGSPFGKCSFREEQDGTRIAASNPMLDNVITSW